MAIQGEQNRSGLYCGGSTLSHILIKQLVCYSLSNCFMLGRDGENMKEVRKQISRVLKGVQGVRKGVTRE